jgi:hypothetical protein
LVGVEEVAGGAGAEEAQQLLTIADATHEEAAVSLEKRILSAFHHTHTSN